MGENIKVFVSSSCEPCEEIKELILNGRFNQEDVELLDLETDEGYPYLDKLGLTKVPSAYRGNQVCTLQIDDENNLLIIDCPDEEKPVKARAKKRKVKSG